MKTIQVNIMFEYTRQCIFDERWPQFKPMVYQTSANASGLPVHRLRYPSQGAFGNPSILQI